jgi:hypothetical protein
VRARAAAAALLAAACQHSSPSSTTTPVSNTAPVAAHKIASDLELLPVDAEAVIGVNFQQLQASPLWQQFVSPWLASGDSASAIAKFKALCGFDPLTSLTTFALGIKDISTDNPGGAIVIHGYERAKAMSCFDKEGVADVEKDGSKVRIDGDVVMIADKAGKQYGFTFVDDSTVLAVLGPDAATKDSIKRVASGDGHGLSGSSAFGEMYGKVNTHDSVWMLLNAQTPAFRKAELPGAHMKAVFGSINVTDSMTADFRIRVASSDEATNLHQSVQGDLANPKVKEIFDRLDVTTEGPDLKVAAAIGHQKLQTIVGMLMGVAGSHAPTH